MKRFPGMAAASAPFASAALAIVLSGCALIWGFEEHEPFPAESQGGSGGGGGSMMMTSSSSGGTGAASSSSVVGGGGTGGEPGIRVALVTDIDTNAIGAYSRTDGSYLGDFLPPSNGTEGFDFEWPVIATQGPDGKVYVVDDSGDAIYRFTSEGEFDGTYLSASDGLSDPQTIAFRNEEAFVPIDTVSSDPVIARFDLSGNRLADFVTDSGGATDIFFLPAGQMLSVTGELSDEVRLYDVAGGSFNYNSVTTTSFGAQIYAFDDDHVLLSELNAYREFKLDGTDIVSHAGSGGIGMVGLDNGNWMVTDVDGILAIDPLTGPIDPPIRVGTSFWRIGVAVLPSVP